MTRSGLVLTLVVVVVVGLGSTGCVQRRERVTAVDGNGLMSPVPGVTAAELFGPGRVSTGFRERDIAFMPDGGEFYYSVILPDRRGVIMHMVKQDDRWTAPNVAPFSGEFSDIEPFMAPDGERLYFASNRPRKEGGRAADWDIWYVERTLSGWSLPVNPGPPVNTDGNEFYPSLTGDGTLYLTADYDGSDDIYRAEFTDGKWTAPLRLSAAINSDGSEFNAMIAPGGDYLIFTAVGREDGHGDGDLYISFIDSTGDFLPANNMGAAVNSPALEYCPALGPHGAQLFFTSRRNVPVVIDDRLRSLRDIQSVHAAPQNGTDDIYWIDAAIIEVLRPR